MSNMITSRPLSSKVGYLYFDSSTGKCYTHTNGSWAEVNIDNESEPGAPGEPGVSLNFLWSGTTLGIKREDEANYEYVDLKGEDGYTPVKNTDYFDGLDGKSMDFVWNGYELGIKVEGQPQYQYVNLRGRDGPPGEEGYTPIKGLDYFDGKDGYTPIKGVDYFDGKQGPPGTTAWGGITDKPSTFPPALHNHDSKYRNIIAYYQGGSGIDPNDTAYSYIVSSHANTPKVPGITFWHIQTLFYSSTTGNRAQIAQSYNGPSVLYTRTCSSGTWSEWVAVATQDYVDSKVIASGGTTIITSATEPILNTGDQWHREI